MKYCQKITLVITACAVSFSFLGCDSTAPDATNYDVLASAPKRVVYNEPTPEIKIGNDQSIEDFAPDISVSLTNISAQQRGPDNTPFSFEQKTTLSDGEIVSSSNNVYPHDNTTANLIFYNKVGLPLMKVEELDDEFIRIWLRVRNLKENDIFISVKCVGNDDFGRIDESYNYNSVIFEEDVFRDFTFVLKGSITKKFSIIVTESARRG